MLMGMHNALSTTVALAAVGYGLDPVKQETTTLRSSDDSTSVYFGIDARALYEMILIEIWAQTVRHKHEFR